MTTNSDEYAYCALIDVLGYRELLDLDRSVGKLEFKDKLVKALGAVNNVSETVIQHKAISDTIILTTSEPKNFGTLCEAIVELFHAFLSQGIFVRGGLAYGNHYHSQSVVYSQALTVAHKLESAAAIFPRVVVDTNAIEVFRSYYLAATKKPVLPKILRDGPTHYIDVVPNRTRWDNAYRHAKRIAENLGSIEPSVYEKHLWFHDYLFRSDAYNKKMKPHMDQPYHVWYD
jgi:hypothetical protein